MTVTIHVNFEQKKPVVVGWIKLLTELQHVRAADQSADRKYPSAAVAKLTEKQLNRPTIEYEQRETDLIRIKYTPKAVTLDVYFYSKDVSEYNADYYASLFFDSLLSIASIDYLSDNGLALLDAQESLRMDEKISGGWRRREMVEIRLQYVNIVYEPVDWIEDITLSSGTVHTSSETIDIE